MAQEPQQLPYRRRFPRRQFHNSVGLLARGTFTVVAGQEIGEGGLLLNTFLDLAIGIDVVVNFYVPGRSFITVRGAILYSIPNKPEPAERRSYGIKFHNLSFEAKRMIRDYIAEKTAQEASAI